MELKRGSLFYKFLTKMGGLEEYHEYTDTCKMLSALLKALLMGCLCIIPTVVIALMLSNMMAWLAFWVINWAIVEPHMLAVEGIGLLLIVGSSFLRIGIIECRLLSPKWVKPLWNSFTGKVCVKVHFKTKE